LYDRYEVVKDGLALDVRDIAGCGRSQERPPKRPVDQQVGGFSNSAGELDRAAILGTEFGWLAHF
jgi:hypothetical protein